MARELHACGETLGNEVGEVDGGVDADGGEDCARVDGGWEVGFGDDAEVRNDIFEPGGWGEEFVEPLPRRSLLILVTVVDYGIWGFSERFYVEGLGRQVGKVPP